MDSCAVISYAQIDLKVPSEVRRYPFSTYPHLVLQSETKGGLDVWWKLFFFFLLFAIDIWFKVWYTAQKRSSRIFWAHQILVQFLASFSQFLDGNYLGKVATLSV